MRLIEWIAGKFRPVPKHAPDDPFPDESLIGLEGMTTEEFVRRHGDGGIFSEGRGATSEK